MQPSPGYGGLSSIASIPSLSDRGRSPSQDVTGPARAAPVIFDVPEDSPSPQAVRATPSQRLGDKQWLQTDDIFDYAKFALQAMTKAMARKIGQTRSQALRGQLSLADPHHATQLINGSAGLKDKVRDLLPGPIVFMPVSNADKHWSLLVVNRDSQQAFHYDSMVRREHLRMAPSTAQFQKASLVAKEFGINLRPAPTALQHDEYSCGDHVAAGIEALASGFLNSNGQRWAFDLSGIEPNRDRIIKGLTQHEQPPTGQTDVNSPHSRSSTVDLDLNEKPALDIGHLVGPNWQHGPQFLSGLLTSALDNAGLRPTQRMPQTTFQINGEPYAAELNQGFVWVAPLSSMQEAAGPSHAMQPAQAGTPSAGPSSSQPSGAPQAPDFGHAVDANWIHGDQTASLDLMFAMAEQGVLPSPQVPRREVQIRGERYTAQIADPEGHSVRLSWAPRPGAALPPGLLDFDRNTLLDRINARMGHASGQGLNCLLDSISQLAFGTPRRPGAFMPEMDARVRDMRQILAAGGLAPQQGELDVYESGPLGAMLADTFNLRLQFIQQHEDIAGMHFVHPVLGQEGLPIVRILNTPGHFQPLWPRQE
jgi:hypothetical protein